MNKKLALFKVDLLKAALPKPALFKVNLLKAVFPKLVLFKLALPRVDSFKTNFTLFFKHRF